jgi:pimeloyl-ACP methyl ester carboxylesterase
MYRSPELVRVRRAAPQQVGESNTPTTRNPKESWAFYVLLAGLSLTDRACIMGNVDKVRPRVVGLVLYVYVFLAGLATGGAGWLLAVAQTWPGRGLALLVLLLVWLPLLIVLSWQSRGRKAVWRWLALAYGVAVVGITVGILITVPDGRALDGARAQSRFVGDGVSLPRFSLTNVVPEMEQINMGLALIPYLDPIIDREQARRLASFILPAYREMETNPEFHRLGSAMGWAYAELLGQPFDVGHYYLYVPQNRPSDPLPAILFLHGSAGNFKVYTWAWSRLADEQGCAIIAPSFGFGNWYQAGGVRAVKRALSDAEMVVPLDDDRIYLVGLSNGGTGVSRVASEMPERFRGLVYVSGVVEPSIVAGDSFLKDWRSRPVLVIHGGADRRIPASIARLAVAGMESGGVDVSYIEYPDEDHFLFLSRLERVLQDVSTWME